jgi:hypothetical protein
MKVQTDCGTVLKYSEWYKHEAECEKCRQIGADRLGKISSIIPTVSEYIGDNLVECCQELLKYDSEEVKGIAVGSHLGVLLELTKGWPENPRLVMRMIRTTAMKSIAYPSGEDNA